MKEDERVKVEDIADVTGSKVLVMQAFQI
jgi:hypothetical protein